MQHPPGFSCATCGAELVVDGSTPTPTCAYCGAQTALPANIWARFEREHEAAAAEARAVADRAAKEKDAALAAKGKAWEAIGGALPTVALLLFIGVGGILGARYDKKSKGPINPFVSAGGPCNGHSVACSKDKKSKLVCGANGKMVVASTCKGLNDCQKLANNVLCDNSLADVEDPCDTAGNPSCSTDHKSELRCLAGHNVVVSTCKGPDGCMILPSVNGAGDYQYQITCDDHIADVGDPCFDGERTACSSDHKSVLTCTAQKFGIYKRCKKACVVRKIMGTNHHELDCQ